MSKRKYAHDFLIDDLKAILSFWSILGWMMIIKKGMKERIQKKHMKKDYKFSISFSTDEEDIYNLKINLERKLNETPLKKVFIGNRT